MATETFKQDLLRSLPSPDQYVPSQFGLSEVVDLPFECIHHAFEYHARIHPDLTAVEDFRHKITYAELNRHANCLATRLRSKGVGGGSRVCLLVERSISMVAGILAILKTGAAYVPLDGNNFSYKTLDCVLRDSQSALVLVQRKFVYRIGESAMLCLEDSICHSHSSTHCTKPEDFGKRDDSAYIVYTSGRCSKLICGSG